MPTVLSWLGLPVPRTCDGQSLLPLALRFVRYTLVGFWVSGLGPIIFWWLKLARKVQLTQNTEAA